MQNFPYLTSWQYLARNLPQEPLPCEASHGGEGGSGEAHHGVREGHVAHKQVGAGTEIWGPDNCDDNDDVTNSSDYGDKAIEEEECLLNTKMEDQLLLNVAGGGVTGGAHVGGQVRHSLS